MATAISYTHIMAFSSGRVRIKGRHLSSEPFCFHWDGKYFLEFTQLTFPISCWVAIRHMSSPKSMTENGEWDRLPWLAWIKTIYPLMLGKEFTFLQMHCPAWYLNQISLLLAMERRGKWLKGIQQCHKVNLESLNWLPVVTGLLIGRALTRREVFWLHSQGFFHYWADSMLHAVLFHNIYTHFYHRVIE